MQDTIWNKHYFTSELSSIFERISFAFHKDPKRGLQWEGEDEDGRGAERGREAYSIYLFNLQKEI